MSGIAALLALDGRPVIEADVQKMVTPMLDRGPEGSRVFRTSAVGLGHTALTTSPEAKREIQPLVDPTGRLAIVADARLDNRTELFGLLGRGGDDRSRVGDAELILRAYQRWGDDCPTHLLGDFAFALWDGRHHRLLCARDHLGVKPLCYYHDPGRIAAIASVPKALLELDEIPRRLSESRIADFLMTDLEGIDQTSTFFEGVMRLPPAHTLRIDPQGLTCRRYWSLEPGTELRLPSDADYEEAFLEVFREAVTCRLRNAGSTGSMLSGGMDSGAIVAISAETLGAGGAERLPTFSAVSGASGGCVESEAIRTSMTIAGLDPQVLSATDLGPVRVEAEKLFWQLEDPFDFHMSLVRAVVIAARRYGVTVLLDGIDADTVLSDGGQISQLLRHGRWSAAVEEARGLEAFSVPPCSYRRILSAAARQAFVPHVIRRARRRRRDRAMTEGVSHEIAASLITMALADRVGLEDRLLAARAAGISDRKLGLRERRARSIEQPYVTAALERYDRVVSAQGIEPRHPFLDRRLIELVVSLPGNQLLSGGWPKAVLRRSMEGRLPDAVRWRRGKEHLGWMFTSKLAPTEAGLQRTILESQEVLESYVDMPRVLQLLEAGERTEDILTVAHLGRWLLEWQPTSSIPATVGQLTHEEDSQR